MQLHRKLRWLFVIMILARGVASQDAAPVRFGTWTASAGSAVYRGSWSAETLPGNPNAAQGSLNLINDSHDVVLEGTWSAKRTGTHWHGTWRARTEHGQTFSGTWDADLPDSKGDTFAFMLTRTLENEVAGSWQSGNYQGYWWLKGMKPKNAKR